MTIRNGADEAFGSNWLSIVTEELGSWLSLVKLLYF